MQKKIKKVFGKLCPRCGRVLFETSYAAGEVDEDHNYAYQCIECDEDFYESEAVTEQRARKEFYVDTPLGKLHVYEKADPDYPGIIVDLINPKLSEDDGLICCVEYEQLMQQIQTVTYRPGEDEPTDIIVNYEEG